MIPNNSGLAGLGLAECDAEVLSELLEYLVCLSVTNAAAADQERLLCVLDDLNSLVQSVLGMLQPERPAAEKLQQHRC